MAAKLLPRVTARGTTYVCSVGTDDREERWKTVPWGTAGGAGGDSTVSHVILVTHSRNPTRVDGKMLKEEADNFLRAYDTYCRRTEDDWAPGVQCKLYKMSELLLYSQKDAISLFFFGGRRLT